MDIYLSVNNREEIIKIPVIPSEFTISKPQSLQTFETVSKGNLQLIGAPKLKGITIESFFPVRDYPYLRDRSMKGWEYVYKIDIWIQKKLPIRLIVSDTPINMVVAVKDFSYTVKADGDLWYTLTLEQFNLLGYENPQEDEEEIDMEELNALKEQVEYLKGIVEELANPFIYNYIDDNMPDFAKEAVTAAVNRGCISGDGDGLDLDYKDLRHITMMHRAGAFGMIYNYNDSNMPEWAREWVQKAVTKGYITGDESGELNFTLQDLRLLTIMGRAGLFD